MFRFIAFLGERTGACQSLITRMEAEGRWRTALHASDAIVLAGRATPLRPWRGGVVLGRVFGAWPSQEVDAGDIVGRAWGRYVAFWGGRASAPSMLRDPSGAIPCFLARSGRLGLAFSHLEDVHALLGALCPEQSAIGAWLLGGGGGDAGETALSGVTALAPGALARWERVAWAWRQVWRASDIARADAHPTPAAARTAITSAARHVLASELDGRAKALLELSGGLDSSILAGLMRETKPDLELACVTYHAGDGDSDERGYARLASAHARAELNEVALDPHAPSLEHVLKAPLTPLPCEHVTALAAPAASLRIAAEFGVDALFAGQGGDHVFHDARRPWGAADWARAHGWGWAFFARVRETAALTRRSYWSILHATFAPRPALPHLPESLIKARRLLGPAISAAPQRVERAGKREGLPPGKRAHVRAIEGAGALWAPVGRSERIEIIHPFLAQPVVEACLRTPVYMLSEGGARRALQRTTFSGCAPGANLARTGKGGSSGFNLRVLEANRDFARPFICDGRLATMGFLDVEAASAMLRRPAQATGAESALLMRLIAAEAWLRALDDWNARAHSQ